jgi:hypothetical protein
MSVGKPRHSHYVAFADVVSRQPLSVAELDFHAMLSLANSNGGFGFDILFSVAVMVSTSSAR